jgi:hypothetical protein
LNDGVVHEVCLKQQEYAERALARLRDVENHSERPKRCDVCGPEISALDDYFATGPLGQRQDDPLSQYDWLEVQKHCLAEWRSLDDMIAVVTRASRSPEWEGDVLERMLSEIAEAVGTVDRIDQSE